MAEEIEKRILLLFFLLELVEAIFNEALCALDCGSLSGDDNPLDIWVDPCTIAE